MISAKHSRELVNSFILSKGLPELNNIEWQIKIRAQLGYSFCHYFIDYEPNKIVEETISILKNNGYTITTDRTFDSKLKLNISW